MIKERTMKPKKTKNRKGGKMNSKEKTLFPLPPALVGNHKIKKSPQREKDLAGIIKTAAKKREQEKK